MRTVAIVHARMGSTRLPGKSLLPLAGKPLVQNILERVLRTRGVARVVLAVPLCDREAFLFLTEALPEIGFYAYPGDPNDVVARLHLAAYYERAELVLRIPADNPCVDPVYLDQAIQAYCASPSIYLSTCYVEHYPHVFLDGVGGEVLSASRLQWLQERLSPDDRLYREHPHKLFEDQHLIAAWEQYSRRGDLSRTIRLDVNTPADYEFIASIYTHFGHNRFTTQEVVAHLSGERPMSSV